MLINSGRDTAERDDGVQPGTRTFAGAGDLEKLRVCGLTRLAAHAR